MFLLMLVLLSYIDSSKAQVLNIDRNIESDSSFRRIRAAVNFNFSNDRQKRNLVDFSNNAELDLFLKRNYLVVFLSQTALSLNGLQVLENNGFFQLRYRDNDTRKMAPDVFCQYQWNGVQGMQHRSLLGANLRMRWMEKKKSDLYTGFGVFYEVEKWNPFLSSYAFKKDGLNVVYRNFFRLNTSAKFALKLSKSVDFVGNTFVQFPMNEHFLTPRWFFDSNLFFVVNKHLSFIIHYDHNLDRFRPLPIYNYYYTATMGIQVKI